MFEESYRQIMKLRVRDLKKKLMVRFRGEDGLDYGGIAREWIYQLSHEMLNPKYGLFQYSRGNVYTLQINPDSSINPVSAGFSCSQHSSCPFFLLMCMNYRSIYRTFILSVEYWEWLFSTVCISTEDSHYLSTRLDNVVCDGSNYCMTVTVCVEFNSCLICNTV